MSTSAPSVAPPAASPAHDRMLIAVAAVALVISVAMAVAGEVLHVAVPLVLVLVVAGIGIGLRILLRLRARRSAALSNRRVMNVVSSVGLGLSVVAALVELGAVLPQTSAGNVAADLALHLVSIAILVLVAAPVRTIGWRALLGTGLASFLAVFALARGVGVPIIDWLGPGNQFAVAFYVPLTEELLKLAPVLLVLLPALRSGRFRPTAVDIALLGLVSGTGFAIIENAGDDRVLTGASTPLIVLYPSMTDHLNYFQGVGMNVAGHAVWTAFAAMGLGFGLLYRRRFRFAWIAIPVTFLLALAEHGASNADSPPSVLLLLTANGLATPVLLTLGLLFLIAFEAGTPEPFGVVKHPRSLLPLWRSGLILERPVVGTRAGLAAARERPAAIVEGGAR